MFFLQQNWRTTGWNRFPQEGGGEGKMTQTMYIHVSKCKTDKNKIKKN
jgi:hypothetical protein